MTRRCFSPAESGGWTVTRTITAANAGQALFVRVERQTLSRLPATGAVLFTIRVHVYPLGRVVARPEIAARLDERGARAAGGDGALQEPAAVPGTAAGVSGRRPLALTPPTRGGESEPVTSPSPCGEGAGGGVRTACAIPQRRRRKRPNAARVVSDTWCSIPSASCSAASAGTPSATSTIDHQAVPGAHAVGETSPGPVRNTPR